MAGVFPNAAEDLVLKLLINQASPQSLVLKLFTNDVTPGETDTEATYTEASGHGYAPATLTPGTWTVTTGFPSQAAYPAQTFTFTGPLGNVYGYYLTQVSSGKLLVAERFQDAPLVVANNGDEIRVSVAMTLD